MSELPSNQQAQAESPHSPEDDFAARRTRPILASGKILFSIQTPEGPQDIEMDVLWLKLTCEEVEKQHNLETDAENRLIPTAKFLDDLKIKLQERVPTCGETVAWQMWIAVAEAMSELKNAMSGMPR